MVIYAGTLNSAGIGVRNIANFGASVGGEGALTALLGSIVVTLAFIGFAIGVIEFLAIRILQTDGKLLREGLLYVFGFVFLTLVLFNFLYSLGVFLSHKVQLKLTPYRSYVDTDFWKDVQLVINFAVLPLIILSQFKAFVLKAAGIWVSKKKFYICTFFSFLVGWGALEASLAMTPFLRVYSEEPYVDFQCEEVLIEDSSIGIELYVQNRSKGTLLIHSRPGSLQLGIIDKAYRQAETSYPDVTPEDIELFKKVKLFSGHVYGSKGRVSDHTRLINPSEGVFVELVYPLKGDVQKIVGADYSQASLFVTGSFRYRIVLSGGAFRDGAAGFGNLCF